MRILFVEDNYDKYPIVAKALSSFSNIELTKVVSVSDALAELSNKLFDVLIIDIQIPDINGGDINPEGGLELLEKVECLTNSIIPRYIFGLSSHSDDVIKFKPEFAKYGWCLFDIQNDAKLWKDLLVKKAEAMVNNPNYRRADIAIITALEDTELKELLSIVDGIESVTVYGYKYYFYELTTTKGNKFRVVSAAAEKMGLTWSSQVATRIMETFRPKMLFMTGICAGVKGKASLGDIIVGDPVWDWGAGKISEDDNGNVIFLPEPHQLSLNRKIKERFKDIAIDDEFFSNLVLRWKQNKLTNAPELKIAPMACGASVIATQVTVDDIAGKHRKVSAIEMESYAIMAVAASYDVPCAVIKSICDLGDVNKSDDIQNYCAYTSASVALKFIKEKTDDLL